VYFTSIQVQAAKHMPLNVCLEPLELFQVGPNDK
jgi:hypothetical protein